MINGNSLTICLTFKISCQDERQWTYFVLAMGATFGILLTIAIVMALLRWLLAGRDDISVHRVRDIPNNVAQNASDGAKMK